MAGPLRNSRWERFAQELVQGYSADEAYAKAGYRADRRNAARTRANAAVRSRVAELQAIGAQTAAITLEGLLAEAEAVRVQAMATGQLGAAIAAIKEKGVLTGLRVEKRENTNRQSLDRMTDEELEAIVRGPDAMH